jgi:HD-GYP domain-containing protein (c-di-GMP phosphodiesterase class II)
MRKHPQYGHEFLVHLPFLKNAADLVLSHHEKFDGSGYPRRLSGEDIPVGARVFAIVDAVDALIFDRPYHAGVSFEEAEAEIERCSGTHFDPDLVKPALEFIRREMPAAA